MVTPDGMPMVWLLRLDGHQHVNRVYGPDLMEAVFAAGVGRGIRHFMYGSAPETLIRLQRNILARFPDSRLVGHPIRRRSAPAVRWKTRRSAR